MMLTSVLIAIPTGIKIFSWLATLYKGVIHTKSAGMLFALGFICSFVLGGISGVMIAMVPFDIHVSDTYFMVAHIHFVLFAGSVFTIFAGIYHWFPKITGRMYDQRLGRWHFWLTLIGTWGTFVPMHWLGMQGMPRRVADYASQFGDWNLFDLGLRLHAGRRSADLPLQHGRLVEVGAGSERQSVARQVDRMARLFSRRRVSTLTMCRSWSAALTSSAFQARATHSCLATTATSRCELPTPRTERAISHA